jgi:hypothetical protein
MVANLFKLKSKAEGVVLGGNEFTAHLGLDPQLQA